MKPEELVKPNAKVESEESVADEMNESSAMQTQEQREGTEEHPEEAMKAFQQHCDEMLKDATPEQIAYLKSKLEAMSGEEEDKGEFSMEGMEE